MILPGYEFKTQPLKHQADELIKSTEDEFSGYFWEPGCVDSTTECLTPSGWLKISEWEGQEIAQWDPETEQASFIQPVYVKQPYTGPMLLIKGRNGPEQLVCPDHKIPLASHRSGKVIGMCTASDLEKSLRPEAASTRKCRRMPARWTMSGGQGIALTDQELRLQIAVMADGHFQKGCSTNRVVINLKRERKIKRLSSLLEGWEHRKKYNENSGYTIFTFYAPLRMKRWPTEWWQATERQRSIILEELVHWDGSVPKGNRGWSFCSKYEADVDVVHFLACAQGILAKKIGPSNGMWYVACRGKNSKLYSVRHDNTKWVGPPSDGHRYCFTVPTGFWIARRKGHAYPTGNCGKSYLIINQAGYLYEQGKIDTLVVVAPNGVHLNWCSDEVPKHMPDRIQKRMRTVIYHSSKAKSKKAQKQREDLLSHEGLAVLVVAYEATITETFKAYMKRFFAKRKSVFMCLDEAHRIKGRNAKVKTTLVAMGKHAKFRRILTGTPVEIPVDVYSELRFLDQKFWSKQGFPTSVEFDNFFCEFEDKSFVKRAAGGRIIYGKDGAPERNIFRAVTGYKNIDKLQKIVAEVCSRLTLEEAGIHLPPVTYSKRYYEMFSEQRRMYEQLRTEFRTEFEDGTEIDAETAITRLLRLQQVICGYCGTGPGEPIKAIREGENPRLDLCLEILEDLPHQALIFARFTEDINQLCTSLGDQCVRYDGQVDNDGRALAKRRFQAGDAKFMVLSEAGAEGLTLVGAKTTIFYSSHFKMIKRIQQEARNYRIGQNDPVHVIDLVCEGTVDNQIIDTLRSKKDVADQLVGDKMRGWI